MLGMRVVTVLGWNQVLLTGSIPRSFLPSSTADISTSEIFTVVPAKAVNPLLLLFSAQPFIVRIVSSIRYLKFSSRQNGLYRDRERRLTPLRRKPMRLITGRSKSEGINKAFILGRTRCSSDCVSCAAGNRPQETSFRSFLAEREQ